MQDAWDIETAEYVRELDISNHIGTAAQEDYATHGFFIRKDDGSKMWIFNRTEIWEYTLSSPWDITSATQTGYRDFSNHIVRGHDIDFKPDGTKLFIDDRLFSAIFEFELQTPWDVESASLNYVFDISDEQEEVRGIQLTSDGQRMFLMDTGRHEILEYYLESPFDLQHTSFIGSFNVQSESNEPRGITLKPGKKKFFITETGQNMVFQYKISSVDKNNLTFISEFDEVIADGEDFASLIVSVVDEDGDSMTNVVVELLANSSNIEFEENPTMTNEDGEANFRVYNLMPEEVAFSSLILRKSGNIEVDDAQRISFLPRQVVPLTALDVNEDSFLASWEMINGATNYVLQISGEKDFSTFINSYENRDVGEVTEHAVSGLSPGSKYYYRVRAETGDLIGDFSDEIEVVTFPKVPEILTPKNISLTQFTARWESTKGAQGYKIDVALDENFEEMVTDYERFELDNQLSFNVTGLKADTDYYYRVRSRAHNRVSDNSGYKKVTTLKLDPERSDIISSQLRVFADGQQSNIITVRLNDTDGNFLKKEQVIIVPDSGSSKIEESQKTTDDNGEASFSVSNSVAEKVRYEVHTANELKVGNIELEFLPVENQLNIGDNFPNPFNNMTIIPVAVPERMHVRIDIINVLGSKIKTVVNEEIDSGYYEFEADLSANSSGVYFYRMITDEKTETKKMMFVR